MHKKWQRNKKANEIILFYKSTEGSSTAPMLKIYGTKLGNINLLGKKKSHWNKMEQKQFKGCKFLFLSKLQHGFSWVFPLVSRGQKTL